MEKGSAQDCEVAREGEACPLRKGAGSDGTCSEGKRREVKGSASAGRRLRGKGR